MHKRLSLFLYRYNILCKHQYSLQRDKSTDHAILDLHNNIIKAVENRKKLGSIFLDFAKVFGTFNHYVLMKKIKML